MILLLALLSQISMQRCTISCFDVNDCVYELLPRCPRSEPPCTDLEICRPWAVSLGYLDIRPCEAQWDTSPFSGNYP